MKLAVDTSLRGQCAVEVPEGAWSGESVLGIDLPHSLRQVERHCGHSRYAACSGHCSFAALTNFSFCLTARNRI